VEQQRRLLRRAHPESDAGRILALELDLAARMAIQSCELMLWQQALAAGKDSIARRLAKRSIGELRALDDDFNAYWPRRNKASAKRCSAFLRWRIEDYRNGALPYPPEMAR